MYVNKTNKKIFKIKKKCAVTPILEYGSSVWGFNKAPEINLIQN